MSKQIREDIVLCSVEFSSGGKTYSYMDESASFKEGDIVLVQAGKENHESVVRIVSKKRCSVDCLPLPLEKIKSIIRRANEEEMASFRQSGQLKSKKKNSKQSKKVAHREEPNVSEGVQPDGSLVFSYEDYAVELFDGMDYEVTYKLDAENAEKLREYLSKKYKGSLMYMIEQECGYGYRKKSVTELFDEVGVRYDHFVWIS